MSACPTPNCAAGWWRMRHAIGEGRAQTARQSARQAGAPRRRAAERELPACSRGSARASARQPGFARARMAGASPLFTPSHACADCAALIVAGADRRAVRQRRDRPRAFTASARGIDPARRRCRLRHFRNPHHRQPPHAHRHDPRGAGHASRASRIFAADLSSAPAPASWRWTGSRPPMCMRRYPDSISVTSWKSGPSRCGSRRRCHGDAPLRGGTLRRRDHQPGRREIPPTCPSWSAPARPKPPPNWWMRCMAHRAVAARVAAYAARVRAALEPDPG